MQLLPPLLGVLAIMERLIWHFRLNVQQRLQPWPCPSCGQAALSIIDGSLHSEESRDSVEARSHEDWGPEWTDCRFVCLLRCVCGEVVAVIGRRGFSEEFYPTTDGDDRVDYEDRYEPLSFHPAPPIIAVPAATPTDVKGPLVRSFNLYWSDVEACANGLRSATEKLLDHVSVPRSAPDRKGKIRQLSLANRLAVYARDEKAMSETLSAVRVLGNVGSHSGNLTREDLLDAYEIMLYALEEIVLQKSKRIAKIAGEITARAKPRSQRE